ncbi:MAG: class I tRNA ligase family protein [Patescibacteria group bacterium]
MEEKKWVNPIPEREREIQKFWADNKIFEKSLEQTRAGEAYSFYDGPPFATGTPHYGHMVASLMKDVVPRFWTMRGRYVERRWGWDCHGLPIENIVEKELGFKSKKDIEDYGIGRFNEYCRSKVLVYVEEWKKTIARFGRWADMDNSYKTMDLPYMESIWWVFKELYDKGLVYEGYKSMHICPRCETTLSQQEVSEGYKDIKDLSVIAKFKLKAGQKIRNFITDDNTYVLAWTTTPWTLPGNVALAVGEDVDYVLFKRYDNKNDVEESFISSKQYFKTLGNINGEMAYFRDAGNDPYVRYGKEELIKEFGSLELIDKKYQPLFPYYEKVADIYGAPDSQINPDNNKRKIGKRLLSGSYSGAPTNCFDRDDLKEWHKWDNAYKIVSADFVTTEDGTGVVHIAPAYGEEDMQLGKEENLPMIQNVTFNGNFKDEVVDFSGLNVKPAEDTKATDRKVIEYLDRHNLLFASAEYEHSYPHCWRCDTPLINYATSSWFVKVTDIKSKALETAKGINWSPAHIKDGRFGKWLLGARDWSISRQRFWASVIPLWRCECGEIKVIGSVAELEELKINRNNFFAIRHGEAEKNIKHVFSSGLGVYPLTANGREQIKIAIDKLKDKKISLIVSSEVLRAKETAQLIAEATGAELIFDARLNELNAGELEERSDVDGRAKEAIAKWKTDWDAAYPGGESVRQVTERTLALYQELNEKYEGKNILLVSHEDTLKSLLGKLYGYEPSQTFGDLVAEKGQVLEIKQKITDLHKHFVDQWQIVCPKCGRRMDRIPDVLDTWFDSGSMPYAQQHYPFENQEKFLAGFPAQFIAEGVDQTRAWFYYLHIIAAAVRGSEAFKNVIVNGIVLAEDGKKMSKRLQNYTEPEIIMDKYGADALRFYLLTAPVMSAENLNFSDEAVKEAMQKVTMLLNNILSFYKLYETPGIAASQSARSNNILDKWLFVKLNLLILEVTKNMEAYDLPRATRPLAEFIDEFSTRWLQSSRDRLKGDDEADKNQAIATFHVVLLELSKIMAPFTPFVAEYVYKQIGGDKESVHLETWPQIAEEFYGSKEAAAFSDKLKEQMSLAATIEEMGLSARAEAKIKIRQPLSKATVFGLSLAEEEYKGQLMDLIKNKLNIKNLEFAGGTEIKLELDTDLTDELKTEGAWRELVRTINTLRKDAGLTIKERIKLSWQSEGSIVKRVFAAGDLAEELKKATLAQELIEADSDAKAVNINGEKVKIKIEKL